MAMSSGTRIPASLMARIAETFANLSFAERLEGFRRALAAHGIAVREEWLVTGEPEGDEPVGTTYYGWKAMKRILATGEIPTAVVAANDSAAVGAMRAIKEAGMRVPDDIAIVGFDDAPWAAHLEPLTTVHVSRHEMGRVAARRLLDLLEGHGGPPMEIKLAATLVVRGSCGSGGKGGESG
ncbi:MAG: LacI family transcriptional regulator [Caldiserica bacterium]|nr:LacI family transcriptional regulator [Caldisericota bacterium]